MKMAWMHSNRCRKGGSEKRGGTEGSWMKGQERLEGERERLEGDREIGGR